MPDSIYRSTIGIDASRALMGRKTGTEHYSASLLAALARLPEAERYRFLLYVNADYETAIERLGFALPANWRVRAIPFPRLWTHLRLSWEMLTRPPGTLFIPSHVVPTWHPTRTVVTIHDLGYLCFPQAHTRWSRFYLNVSTWFSVRAARRVIAISEATRRDLVKHYKTPTSKIRVIYHGRDSMFAPVTDEKKLAETAARYGVGRLYCIHVGTLQPRKNLSMLVKAWDELRSRTHNLPQLLLAGKHGWLYDSLLGEVRARGLGDLVKLANYVQRDDLPALYSGALALTLPSLYEGFGLPALEAMACGTPVIASNSSSLPEVVGDAGVLLDPNDVSAWADAVLRLMNDEALRKQLSRLGLQRAARFSWERCARQTLHVLTEPV